MTGFVYFFRPVGLAGPIKIGHSKLCAERATLLTRYSPIPLEIVAKVPGGNILEGRFHAKFAHLLSHAEWFQAAPELLATIDAINAGTFDADDLPRKAAHAGQVGRWDEGERARASLLLRLAAKSTRIGIARPEWVVEAIEHLKSGSEEQRDDAVSRIEAFIADPLTLGIPLPDPRSQAKLAAYRAGTYRYRRAA